VPWTEVYALPNSGERRVLQERAYLCKDSSIN
jgi:hypothetical protein